MHPWMTHRLAEDRRHELSLAAARVPPGERWRGTGAGSRAVNKRITRHLGELLIKTGWRLVGAGSPVSGARSRLVLGGSVGSTVDSG